MQGPPPNLEQLTLPGAGLRLNAVAAGPSQGPLVLLLHGFPEFWYGWRRQIGALAAAGWRVVALDQRGYNLSDKPRRVADYHIDRLAADVTAVISALGREQAALVGHDWGAAVAWHVAGTNPERVSRLAILNVPHPRAMAQALRRQPSQMARSWYILFFQLPWLPEALMRMGNFAGMARALTGSALPGTFSAEDLALYREAWSQPGALRGMVNWYRAAFRRGSQALALGRVAVPTLILWGARDRFLGRELAKDSLSWCERSRLVYFEDATHWVQHEETEQVNEALIGFLGEEGGQ